MNDFEETEKGQSIIAAQNNELALLRAEIKRLEREVHRWVDAEAVAVNEFQFFKRKVYQMFWTGVVVGAAVVAAFYLVLR